MRDGGGIDLELEHFSGVSGGGVVFRVEQGTEFLLGGVEIDGVGAAEGFDQFLTLAAEGADFGHVVIKVGGWQDAWAFVRPWQGLLTVELADLAVDLGDRLGGFLGEKFCDPAARIPLGGFVLEDFTGDADIRAGGGE